MIKYHLITDDRGIITSFTNKLKDAKLIRFNGLSKNYSEINSNMSNIYSNDIIVISETLSSQFLEKFIRLFITNSTSSAHAGKVCKLVLVSEDDPIMKRQTYLELGFDGIINNELDTKELVKVFNRAIYRKICTAYNRDLKDLLEDGIEIPGFNEELSDVLHDFGIPASLTGYQYLKRAIEIAFLNIDTVVGGVTKVIYPTIALMYGTTPPRVERSMRHAVETGWSRAKIEAMENIFSYSYSNEKGKPTNGEFIANIAEHLITQYRKERKIYISEHPENIENVKHIIDFTNNATEENVDAGIHLTKDDITM